MKFLVIATLTAAAPLAFAAGSSPDHSFYHSLAEGGMAEVDLGQLAEQKGSDPKVKQFAQMMVKDHTAANEKLDALAASKQVALPKTLDASHEAEKTKLSGLSGASFDKAYVQSQVQAHEKTVALLEKEISSGEDAGAKSFAQSVLPTVKHHLEAARTLASEEGMKAAQR
jgi:putative membrane protein